MSKHTNASLASGVSIFHGVRGGAQMIRKMSEYFEAHGAGKHGKNITATGVINLLLDGELDVVRRSDGKGFWNETGYDERPEI